MTEKVLYVIFTSQVSLREFSCANSELENELNLLSVQDVREIITDSKPGHSAESNSKIKIDHWRGLLCEACTNCTVLLLDSCHVS